QYQRTITVEFEQSTSNTGDIIKYALKGFDLIYRKGYQFMKAGVIVMDIVSQNAIQASMFDTRDNRRNETMMHAMDRINKSMGKEIVRMAVQGFEKNYRMKAQYLSPKYTTRMEDILKVNI
ncbi:MAG: DUF4113 domain-containing protein, partial [Chryseobacterium sp.]